MNNLLIYIHWPFCQSKCPYCDFNSHVSDNINHDAWAKSYLIELEHFAELTKGRPVTSVFFGGGTPSLMKTDTVGKILNHISKLWPIERNCEITLEANPTSIEAGKFKDFKKAGINRVSVGVQALNDKDLKFFGRTHSANEALAAVEVARNTFDRYSFDMMYARPGQSAKEWEEELSRALKYMDGHSSLYQLTIEPQTPFYTRAKRGEFRMPEENLSAELYEVTESIMSGSGLEAYEISNYAKPGEESRHNMGYWRYQDYLGIGPGAHGRVSINGIKHATRMHRAPDIWLERVGEKGHGLQADDILSSEEQHQEKIMMGLRLREGVDTALFDEGKLETLIAEGDLIMGEDKIFASLQGRLRLNSVLNYLLN